MSSMHLTIKLSVWVLVVLMVLAMEEPRNDNAQSEIRRRVEDLLRTLSHKLHTISMNVTKEASSVDESDRSWKYAVSDVLEDAAMAFSQNEDSFKLEDWISDYESPVSDSARVSDLLDSKDDASLGKNAAADVSENEMIKEEGKEAASGGPDTHADVQDIISDPYSSTGSVSLSDILSSSDDSESSSSSVSSDDGTSDSSLESSDDSSSERSSLLESSDDTFALNADKLEPNKAESLDDELEYEEDYIEYDSPEWE